MNSRPSIQACDATLGIWACAVTLQRDLEQAEDALREACVERPAWASERLSALINLVSASLPVNDPWRRLRFREDLRVILPTGDEFGDWASLIDILGPTLSRPRADDRLGLLSEPLTGYGQAAILAAAEPTVSRTSEVLACVAHLLSEAERMPRGAALFEAVNEGLRGLLARRACYRPGPDRVVLAALVVVHGQDRGHWLGEWAIPDEEWDRAARW